MGQAADTCGLCGDVIELQHQQIGQATIHAGRSAQRFADVHEIPSLLRRQIRIGFESTWIRPPRPTASGGSPAMAVDADNFADGNLSLECRG